MAMSTSTNGPAVPFMTKTTALRYRDAMEILQNHDSYIVNVTPAVKPKGGQVFLISSGGDDSKIKDWNCDQYHWAVYDGINTLPKRTEIKYMKKAYHKLSRSGSFTRHGWWLISDPHTVLVHYLGDESEYTPTPHGLCKVRMTENSSEPVPLC